MTPLRLGFIGGGINSAVGRAHYAACRMDGRFEVVAGCFSRDEAVNEATGNAFNAAAINDIANFNRNNVFKLDAVVALTPTPEHYASVVQGFERGLPVICEKALASTSAESGRLLDIRDDVNGFLAITYNYTGYPMVRELRDMIQSGELGEIISIQAEMPQEGYLRTGANPQAWRREDGPIPGVHLDLGTHLHHLVHFLTDDSPDSLVAHHTRNSNVGLLIDVVDDVHCIAGYQSGFTASFWFGKTALGYRNGLRIRVNGKKASAGWRQMEPEELHIANADGHRWTMDRSSPECVIAKQDRYQRFKAGHPAGFIEAYANLYYDLADWLMAEKRMKPITYNDGLTKRLYCPEIAHEGLLMMEAMVKSAEEKTWVMM